jgi:UDP:flavonoid glycosyltransferase YjiC (YdhE family)
MLPLALAAHRSGHEVVFATGAGLVAHVERYGLEAWGVGAVYAGSGTLPDSWLRYFAATAAERAIDLVPLAVAWEPDLVIHEETELAGPIVAAATGARHVVHGLGLMPPNRIWAQFAAATEELGRQWDTPDAVATLYEATYLHTCPAALQGSETPPWRHVQPLRPAAGMPVAGDRLPEWIDRLPYQQTIHLTLGTVFNTVGDVLASAIASLRRLPVNLVVTVGPNVDPARHGSQPEHVRVERYVPHDLLLPRCDLVVSQGGAGIMFGALSHGLPQLIIPQGADQFMNADACCAAGAALALSSGTARAETIIAAAQRLLTEDHFTVAARALQAEIAALPDPDAVFTTLAAGALRTNDDRRSSNRRRACGTQTSIARE